MRVQRRGRPHGAQRALLDDRAPSTAGARLGRGGRDACSRRLAPVTLGRPRGRTTPSPPPSPEGPKGNPSCDPVSPLPQAWLGRVALQRSQSPLAGARSLQPRLQLSLGWPQGGEEQVLPGVPGLPTSVGSATHGAWAARTSHRPRLQVVARAALSNSNRTGVTW